MGGFPLGGLGARGTPQSCLPRKGRGQTLLFVFPPVSWGGWGRWLLGSSGFHPMGAHKLHGGPGKRRHVRLRVTVLRVRKPQAGRT